MAFPIGLIVVWLAVVIFLIAAQWRVFEKAGHPGWASIIPIYNAYILLKIGGKPGWWLILLLFLPFIFGIWSLNMVSKSFGKDEGFTVGLVLLGIVFWPILGFGNARYLGPYGDKQKFEEYQKTHAFDFEQN
jgi:hypothetical protein